MFILLGLDVSLMTSLMFQEHHGINLTDQEPKEDSWGTHQGEWDLYFHKYSM